jgi:ribosomal protein S18 acetylase RimI-like enzyme
MNIRRLGPSDAPAFVALRVAALRHEPLAFASSLGDDHDQPMEIVRKALAGGEEQAVYGADEHGELIGIAGVVRAVKAKHRHRAELWGLYVSSEARRRGAGRALVDAIIEHARELVGVKQLHLGVTSGALIALRLFESAGFQTWGRQPRALQIDAVFVDEFHMLLDLDAEPAQE